ncbi:hypothetical protein ACLOJK_028176 [Asimina triloba]
MSFLFGSRKTPAELLRENKRMIDKSIREIERERQGLQTQEKKLIVDIKKAAKEGQMHKVGRVVFKLSHKSAMNDDLLHHLMDFFVLTIHYWKMAVVQTILTHSFVGHCTTTTLGAVRVMAKDLIRTRHQITKFYGLKSQLQGVSLRIQTLKSTQAMGEAMKGVTKAMGQMNRQMNLPALQKIMQEFERQNEKMEMVSEVMGDAIDDALEGDEEETETEELVNQVLDEIGIDINSQLVKAPSSALSAPSATTKVAQAEATVSEDNGIDQDLQARIYIHSPLLGVKYLPYKMFAEDS